MYKQRTDRLNSLLKEVISEVIQRDVRNPNITALISVMRVEITKDLHYAKVFVSMIASDEEKAKSLHALQSASGFIAIHAAKKVTMRYFPELTFKLDDSVEKHLRIETLLSELEEKRKSDASEDT